MDAPALRGTSRVSPSETALASGNCDKVEGPKRVHTALLKLNKGHLWLFVEVVDESKYRVVELSGQEIVQSISRSTYLIQAVLAATSEHDRRPIADYGLCGTAERR